MALFFLFQKCQTSPLIRAIQANQEDVFNLLLKEKPDLNFQDGNGKTCLHWCVKTSSVGQFLVLYRF